MKTGLEAVLQAMVSGGWANVSDGDVQSPIGYFARITITPDEVGECVDAFEDVLKVYPLDALTQLIGYWLVREDGQGSVSVTAYADDTSLTRDFLALQDEYSLWLEENA